jgi:hypothetical protein
MAQAMRFPVRVFLAAERRLGQRPARCRSRERYRFEYITIVLSATPNSSS